ncbi:hypothetical protein L227DRAFT_40208 [Lentinus tigrinus ALCF2SS1-6]|uniref:Uncharacterized protein n=1 Tax=Lentinus tigrinus ALCF2SS1-6 TaxID=1328759 RepID=A0A5C2RMK6_9APHY|nr:hypothetical protein L227DRAFT_40208 [Lentinus tigrinus ALCF2SS1-6]
MSCLQFDAHWLCGQSSPGVPSCCPGCGRLLIAVVDSLSGLAYASLAVVVLTRALEGVLPDLAFPSYGVRASESSLPPQLRRQRHATASQPGGYYTSYYRLELHALSCFFFIQKQYELIPLQYELGSLVLPGAHRVQRQDQV